MKYPQYGIENRSKRHPCLNKSNDSKPGHKQADRRNLYIVGVVVTITFLCGLVLYISNLHLIDRSEDLSAPIAAGERSNDPMVEGNVLAIAQKFVCNCGSCGEESLDLCTCEHAAGVRQIIRGYIQNRKTNEEIIGTINNDFGGLKDEHPKQDQASSLRKPAKVAVLIDRVQIFSHFRCPCGRCGMDNLGDCSCDHPRGAKEVKTFVDKTITEGRYSVNEIVDKVAQTYGSKKF